MFQLFFCTLIKVEEEHLDLLAYTGMFSPGVVVVFGCANMFIMTLLWVLYHSIVNIGQRW